MALTLDQLRLILRLLNSYEADLARRIRIAGDEFAEIERAYFAGNTDLENRMTGAKRKRKTLIARIQDTRTMKFAVLEELRG